MKKKFSGHKGYKGFKKGLVCRGKQYAENTVFEEPNARICAAGMHYCENPFNVLDYYDLVNDDGSFNEFAEVEALEEPQTDDNKKFCTTKLKVGAKLSFGGFVKACVDFVVVQTTKRSKTKPSKSEDVISSKANSARIGSSGDYARIGSSGYSARIGSSGYSARIGSSGDSARIGSSGDYAQIGSSGDSARIDSTGEDSIICCAGHNSIVKAKKGSWITLSEWKKDDNKGRWIPSCVKTEFVDGENIKEDTFYKLENGKFIEVK